MRLDREFIFPGDYVQHDQLTVVATGGNAIIDGGDSNRVDLDSTELVTRNVWCKLTQSL